MMFALLFVTLVGVFSHIPFTWVIDWPYFTVIDNDFSLAKYAVG